MNWFYQKKKNYSKNTEDKNLTIGRKMNECEVKDMKKEMRVVIH